MENHQVVGVTLGGAIVRFHGWTLGSGKDGFVRACHLIACRCVSGLFLCRWMGMGVWDVRAAGIQVLWWDSLGEVVRDIP